MLVEHARNLMGMHDAVHAEYGQAGVEVVSPLACSLDGVDIELLLRPGSQLQGLYGGATVAPERTTCNYGLNPAFQDAVEDSGLVVSGTDDTGEARAVERTDHPFFVGTLYQPQLRSSPGAPHPVFVGLIEAVVASRR